MGLIYLQARCLQTKMVLYPRMLQNFGFQRVETVLAVKATSTAANVGADQLTLAPMRNAQLVNPVLMRRPSMLSLLNPDLNLGLCLKITPRIRPALVRLQQQAPGRHLCHRRLLGPHKWWLTRRHRVKPCVCTTILQQVADLVRSVDFRMVMDLVLWAKGARMARLLEAHLTRAALVHRQEFATSFCKEHANVDQIAASRTFRQSALVKFP